MRVAVEKEKTQNQKKAQKMWRVPTYLLHALLARFLVRQRTLELRLFDSEIR
jgi:hypothetical protein